MAFKDSLLVKFDALQATASEVVDISRYTNGVAQLAATLSGTPTLPTLDVSFEYSLDGIEYFAFDTPIAFTQLTDSSESAEVIALSALPAKFLKVIATVGGSDYADADGTTPAAEWQDVVVKLNLER